MGGPDPLERADADMRRLLETYQGLGGRRIELCIPREARSLPTLGQAVNEIVRLQARAPSHDGVETAELEIAGPGGPITIRLYRTDRDADQAPLLVYLHGGGWVLSDLDAADPVPRAMARKTGAIVASVRYRQAPEHKFPAAFEDAFAAWRWLTQNARDYGADPRRAAIMGEGVGATMALDVAARARKTGERRALHLVMLYPWAGGDLNSPSAVEHARAVPLGAPAIQWFIRHALPSPDALSDPRIDMARRTDLSILPSTTLILAEIDPLRSGAEALGAALQRAGVELETSLYMGVTHGFFGLSRLVNKAMLAEAVVADRLRRVFKQNPVSLLRAG